MASTSTSSSNKRPRTSSTSPKPSDPKPCQAKYYSKFYFIKPDETDLILESSQGQHFTIRKLYLQAASEVFMDTLLIGSDDSSDRIDGLPVLKLADLSYSLFNWLSFVQSSPLIDHPIDFSSSVLYDMLEMCWKYDAIQLGRTISSYAFPRLLDQIRVDETDSCLQDAFALALIAHGRFRTGRFYVEGAVRLMGWCGVNDEDIDVEVSRHTTDGVKLASKRTQWRPFNVNDISQVYYNQLDTAHVLEFVEKRDRVLNESGYSWKEAADDFAL